jgi:hypothetical protein
VPPTITTSSPLSRCTTTRGSAARLRALDGAALAVQVQNVAGHHAPHRGGMRGTAGVVVHSQ